VSGREQGRQRFIEAIAMVTASLGDDPERYLADYVAGMLEDAVPPGEINSRLLGGLFILNRVLLDAAAASTGLTSHQVLQQLAAKVAGADDGPSGPAR
jgi:hypothetical protein